MQWNSVNTALSTNRCRCLTSEHLLFFLVNLTRVLVLFISEFTCHTIYVKPCFFSNPTLFSDCSLLVCLPQSERERTLFLFFECKEGEICIVLIALPVHWQTFKNFWLKSRIGVSLKSSRIEMVRWWLWNFEIENTGSTFGLVLY